MWVNVTLSVLIRTADAQEHQHPAPQEPTQAEHVHTGHAANTLFPVREASGTSWLPDKTPMYAGHGRAGEWELMWHGTVFLQFLNEWSEEHRGAHQTGSINWGMGMARRRVGAGLVGARAMVSLEPWTIRGCGYPDLLATGETCDGDNLHDRQHPHDLFMELAFEYERPIGHGLRWHLYGGPAGEPALGPTAFPHRLSAAANPLAPIGHHWLDATHVTFGVLTSGVTTARWRAEASLFNGREPDENRTDFDFGALDSFSGRLTVIPNDSFALQVSGGRLNDVEAVGNLPPPDLTRVTASGTYHRALNSSRLLATTIAWGMNIAPIDTTHALLVESTLSIRDLHVGFVRFELVGKPAHDLHVHESTDVFVVGKLQGGYTRYLPPRSGAQIGFGGSVSGGLLPGALAPRYGGRVSPGIAVFLTVRPAAHTM
jgi:hypothetical protein